MALASGPFGRRFPAWAALFGTLALAACSGEDLSRNFGLSREAPDEFTVTTRAPLSMPPDYALRPPQPGAPRPQDRSATQDAEATLVPEAALAARPAGADSPGQAALLAAAGRPAPSGIRAQVDAEAARVADDQQLTDQLMFWKGPQPAGTALDASKEADRLRQNAALGKPADTGDSPIIQRKSHSFLDTLF